MLAYLILNKHMWHSKCLRGSIWLSQSIWFVLHFLNWLAFLLSRWLICYCRSWNGNGCHLLLPRDNIMLVYRVVMGNLSSPRDSYFFPQEGDIFWICFCDIVPPRHVGIFEMEIGLISINLSFEKSGWTFFWWPLQRFKLETPGFAAKFVDHYFTPP